MDAGEPLYRWDLPVDEDPVRRLLDRRVPWIIHDETFSQQSFGTGPWPDQGWKLHVSATPLSAVDVLDRVLDVLLADGARFKVVSTVARLGAMNQGLYRISQIGKFVTVYPSDDDHAVRLAVALDQATRGLRGPRVPTDRPLRPGSLVHYRYGSMRARVEGGAAGLNDLLDPAGRLTDDVRLDFYQAPHPAVDDPFEKAGVRVAPLPRGRFLNGRYFVNDALAQSLRGGIFRAVDVTARPARLCLLKESWHDVALDDFGRDARDWAANEERILSRYGDGVVLPRFYDSFDVEGDRYIAIEYIEGKSFDKVLEEEADLRDGLAPAEVVSIGLSTGDALARLHDLGLVFRDFKPANLIKTPDGGYRLIDFGITYSYREDDGRALSIGTPPFFSPAQYEGVRPSPADDVFAWGAVLYHLAGGTSSFSDMADGDDYLRPFRRRPLSEVRPRFPAEVAAVIDRAVAWEVADRYASMAEARDALADAARRLEHRPSAAARSEQAPPPTEATPLVDADQALTLARQVGDALCAAAEERAGGLCWERRAEWMGETGYSPDLYAGAAGIGLFLAELATLTGETRYADAARGAARWLGGPAWGRGRAQHGFHCGEGGIAHFFLRLADLLDTPGYVTAAELRLRRLRGALPHTVDLLYGTAGTVLALVALHAVTEEAETLAEARQLGDHLLATSTAGPRGGRYWDVPGPPGGPIIPFLGLSHGAAGIGLALAHLGIASGDERYAAVATDVADLLLAEAQRSEGGGWAWPRHLGDDDLGLQAPCHGGGGIAQFFLWLDRLLPDPRYREAAIGAATHISNQNVGTPRSSFCHGTSGDGQVLLDCYQQLGDPRWFDVARRCAGELGRFAVADRPGVYAMTDGADAVSPDLFLGYGGVGAFLLRLADADHAPELVLGSLTSPSLH